MAVTWLYSGVSLLGIDAALQLVMPCLGDVKVLASITDNRIPVLDGVPTLGELDPEIDLALWNGLFVRKETPADVRAKIIAVAKETVMSDRAQKLAKDTGALVYWLDADESAARIVADRGTLGAIGKILE